MIFSNSRRVRTDSAPIEHPPAQFAASASDAYQCLLDLKRMRQVIAQYSRLTAEARSAGDFIGDALVANDDDLRDFDSFLQRATPYYWTQRSSELVLGASTSYPLEEEDAINIREAKAAGTLQPPSYLPRVASALAVFQSPCLFFDYHGRREPLSAIGWTVGIHARTGEVRLSIRGIVWCGGKALAVWWSDGGAIGDSDASVDATFRSERIAFTKWICTAAMFVEQEIVVSRRADLDRGLRRRCQKSSGIEPECHVVTLRRDIEAGEETSSPDRDNGSHWTHRWLVRGHWRRQFYPKRGGHAPVWIHPHVKGPEDKPFKEPKPTVYAVTR